VRRPGSGACGGRSWEGEKCSGAEFAYAPPSRRFRPLPVEPGLKHHGRGRAVDAVPRGSVVHALRAQPAASLTRGQPLVVKLDLLAGPRAERAGKTTSTPSGRPFIAPERPRQTDHEQLNLLGLGQGGQGIEDSARIPAVQMVPRVRQEAKLVRYRYADAHLADIDACRSHAGCG
jgi:hypothetical protein